MAALPFPSFQRLRAYIEPKTPLYPLDDAVPFTMSLAGNKRPAASPAAEVEDDNSSRHVRTGNGEKTGPGSSAFTVKRLTIPTEASPGQMLLESPLLLPGLLVCFPHFHLVASREAHRDEEAQRAHLRLQKHGV